MRISNSPNYGKRNRSAMACVLIAIAGSSLGPSALAADAGSNAKALYLRAGTVETAAPVKAFEKVRAIAAVPQRFILQLDGAMTPDRRAALVQAGVKFGGYIPSNAYIVDLSAADTEAVNAMGFVRWVDEYQKGWKIAPELAQQREYNSDERKAIAAQNRVVLNIALFADVDQAKAELKIAAIPGTDFRFTEFVGGQHIVTAIVDREQVAAFAELAAVQFVEEAPDVSPRNSTTRWIIQTNVPNFTPLYDAGIRGEGQIVGVMDGQLDINHCSFVDANPIGPLHRKILAYNTGLGANSHGTHVSGTAIGDSGVDNDLRGIAYAGRIVYNSIPSFTENAMVSSLTLHHNQGARVHTNSWGNDGTTQYDGLARGIDVFSHDNEDSLVLFAVTNGSTLRNPENAKNVLAVGATQDTPSVDSHCTGGAGPTSDGRRKPEIYAPGCSTTSSRSSTSCGTRSLTGTSMASPAIAGAAMLARQYYMDGFYPSGLATPSDSFTPSAALIKATLLNSTRDMTNVAGFPSNTEGWGRLTLDDTLYLDGDSRELTANEVRNADGLSTGESTDFGLNVDSSAEPLRVTLVWTDAPAASGAGFAPVNNLDLVLIAPSGQTFRGNVFSGGVSAPGGSADAINNVEQILIPNPETGSWIVRVAGTAINAGTQGFGLVSSGVVSEGPSALSVSFENVPPTVVSPGQPTEITVRINPGDDELVAGSTRLNLSLGGGPFMEILTTEISQNVFRATIPAADCDDDPRFFVSATGLATGPVQLPPQGAAGPLELLVGDFSIALQDNFESDLGWTVFNDPSITGGAWARGLPLGGGDRSDPATDSDGSGQAFLTDPADGNTDVDGGPTILTSPAFDFSNSLSGEISYDRYYGNTDISDTFAVEISDGGPWVTVENVNPNGASSWTTRTINVGDFVSLTSTVRIRFLASDNPNNSVLEAGVDNVVVSGFTCEAVNLACQGDCNGSGDVNFDDLVCMLFEFGGTRIAMDVDVDCDSNGIVDFDDLICALFLFGPCP